MRIILVATASLLLVQPVAAADLVAACDYLRQKPADLRRMEIVRSAQDGRHVVLALREPGSLGALSFVDCYFADTSSEAPSLIVLQFTGGSGTIDVPVDEANDLLRDYFASSGALTQ